MRGARRGRQFAAVSGTVFFAAVLVWVTLRIVHGDSDSNDKLASVISMYAAIVSFPVAMAALVLTTRQGPVELAGNLDATADVLATSVRMQWETEERVRRVHDPFPLPVHWVNAADNVTDHWPIVHGDPTRSQPIRLAGCGDEIVDVFDRVPSRRLVVLGRAGSGKTILTARFVLAQLSRRRTAADGPVPMVFSLGSWNPTASSLRAWLVERLLSDYPMLADRNSVGMTAAAALLATGRIMPVLDGFDEIPTQLRVHAISAINAGLGPGDRLLLTSRAEEYVAAVAVSDVLAAAAVVELADLDLEDVARYLPLTTRKTGAGTKWHSVMDRLRESAAGTAAEALAATLRTPLMVALARASFSDTDADPRDLLEPDPELPAATLDDRRRAMEHTLFSEFVPAVYKRTSVGEQASFRPPDTEKAEQWLRFLARHFAEPGNRDIAWWQLVSAVPRLVRSVVAGLVIAVLGNCAFGVLLWLGGGWAPGFVPVAMVCGMGFVLACSLVAALVVGLGQQQLGGPPAPSRMWLRVHRLFGRRIGSLLGEMRGSWAVMWVTTWSVGGLLIGLVGGYALDLEGAVLIGLGGGFTIGLVTLLVLGVACLLRTPVDPRAIVSPDDLLRVDRATALSQGLIAGLGGTVAVGLTLWVTVEIIYGLGVSGVDTWISFGVAGTISAMIGWVYFYTVWGPWLLARVWLPLRGKLPWSVMTFLADAHRRGVLRQSGGIYQFRHARLQEHLIEDF
jgi:hypothetical protein